MHIITKEKVRNAIRKKEKSLIKSSAGALFETGNKKDAQNTTTHT